jgi:hypothetical protein
MIDNEDSDYLGLNDADEKRAKRPPGFISSPPMAECEMQVSQEMYLAGLREKQFAGATETLFTVDTLDGEMMEASEAVRWAAIMAWPSEARLPTLAEVEQFQRSRTSKLERAYWDKLRAAVIRDKENAATAEAKRNDAIVKAFRR